MSNKTLRQSILDLLQQEEMTVSQLEQALEVKFSEIESALEHIEKSIRPKKIKSRPAVCQQCGFVFRERKKYSRPSRCPECKSEWIKEASFVIN
jgi:hypothetical protein